jgi:hypothetical protein
MIGALAQGDDYFMITAIRGEVPKTPGGFAHGSLDPAE